MKELLHLFEFTARKTQELSREEQVMGEPLVIDGVTVVPIYKLSCGFAGGGTDLASKRKADALAAGAGAKVTKTPLSFLVIHEGKAQFYRVAAEKEERVSLTEAASAVVALLKNPNNNGAAK